MSAPGGRRGPASGGFGRGLHLALVVLAALPSGARGGAPDPDRLPVYVSDQFKAVAERALRQLAHGEIARACPADRPLCPAVATALADALEDAFAHRPDALRADLSRFFAEATVRGALASVVGDVLDPGALGDAARAIAPLLRCVAGTVTGRRPAETCTVAGRDAEAVTRLMNDAGCDDASCAAVRSAVSAHRPVDPQEVLTALAWIVQGDPINRPQLRVVLNKAKVLLGVGLADGLGPAAFAYLQADREEYGVRVIIDARAGNALKGAALDDEVRALLGKDEDGVRRFGTWTAARERWFEQTRAGLIRGEPLDLDALSQLAELRPRGGKPGDALHTIVSAARVLRAQLEMDQLVRVYGAVLVAALGVADYVRDQDDPALRRNIARAVLYAAAQVAARRQDAALLAVEQVSGQPLAPEDLVTPAEALDSCEVRVVAAELGLARAPAGQCLSVIRHGMESTAQAPPATEPVFTEPWAKAHGVRVLRALEQLLLPAPASAQVAGVASAADWLGARVERVRDSQQGERGSLVSAMKEVRDRARRLAPAELERLASAEVPSSSDRVAGRTNELLQVLRLFADGSDASARRAFLRAGTDGLMARLDEALTALVGGDGARCGERLRSRSIFCRTDAACVAHVLIASAYQPIADFFWEGGDFATGAPGLARNVYTSLLKSPSVDTLPFILNVGLGANYVTGQPFRSASFWGDGGYMALTVVDKFGFAFYQYASPQTKLEVGAFAGGFLDALVRTATDAGKEERFWLLGLTGGFPRLSGIDVGIELHVAAAMPFQIRRGAHYGLAFGAAVVVPFSLVFDKEP